MLNIWNITYDRLLVIDIILLFSRLVKNPLMIVIWKNKGILILVYVIFSFFGTMIINGVLHRNVGGVFSEIGVSVVSGVSLIIAGIVTFLTKEDYYKDRNGKKVKMDTENELFWISMKIWSYILLALGILLVVNGLTD